MPYDPQRHHRRSTRYPGFDYTSPGPYFVTICVQGFECLLGEVADWQMHPNAWGQIVEEAWPVLSQRFPHIELDACVVMPNHFHAIIGIVEAPPEENMRTGNEDEETSSLRTASGTGVVSTPLRQPPLGSLGQIIAYFKHETTKRINVQRDAAGSRFWQRNYYEHIIRNEDDYQRCCRYSAENPVRWETDRENPGNEAKRCHRRG